MMENKKIVYLYTGDHPLHRKYAEQITEEILPFSDNIPKDRDVYFVEGEYARIILMKKLGKINRKAKIIILFSDPRLFYLNSKKSYDSKKDKIVNNSKIKKVLAKRLLKYLDGIICVGKFEESLFRKLNKSVPSRSVIPFINKEIYGKLFKINPRLDNKNILFIANGPDYYYKGIDVLIEVFKEVKKEFPESKLKILGKWEVKNSWEGEGIFFEGRQNDISKYLKESSLYLHLARGEAYGLVVIEAMLAGIPSIVSDLTGAKEAVENVEKNMVVPLKKEDILNSVRKYFKSSLESKKMLSKNFKKESEKFKEEKSVIEFKNKFESLLGEIYGN